MVPRDASEFRTAAVLYDDSRKSATDFSHVEGSILVPITENRAPRVFNDKPGSELTALGISESSDSLDPFFFDSLPTKRDASALLNDCGKLQVLSDLLYECYDRGERCIIFTQFRKMLDILETFVNLQRYRYLRFDGSGSGLNAGIGGASSSSATAQEDRQIAIDRFNEDQDCFLLLASTRACGMGINLTGANVVIFYDSDWNPTVDR